MMMREQIQRFEQNFCVTAGAGAGKTHCMVESYLGLLSGKYGAEPVPPESVAAITFTEAAAAEMKARVIKEANDPDNQKNPSVDWKSLPSRLEHAPISTIHSFCAMLLREFGVLLGLDPDFSVLDEDEFGLLLGQVVDQALRAALMNPSPENQTLLERFPLTQLRETLISLHHGLATSGIKVNQAMEATKRAHQEPLAEASADAARMRDAVFGLEKALKSGEANAKAKYGAKLAQLLKNWPRYEKMLRGDCVHATTLDEIHGLLKNSWGKVNKLKNQLKEIVEGLQLLSSAPEALKLAMALLSLLGRVEESLKDEMGKRAVLSFDSLLLHARELLISRPDVLSTLQQRYFAIMVDEFQDVNPVQGEFILTLAGLHEGEGALEPGASPKPRLLVVGDRKQSIYAFRGAEVEVFSRTMQGFSGKVAHLPDNFRSAPALVDFFNRLFPLVFKSQDGFEHAPNAFVDFSESDIQVPRAGLEPLFPKPVEVVQVEGEEKLAAAGWRELEAQALAGYLQRIITQGVEPGQTAVLLRKLTQVQVYEKALADAGVESYTVKGRGFFQCQEIIDILLAMRAVLDQGDHLALAGFLRSPLVGLSDESLLALAYPQPQERRGLGRALALGHSLPDWLGAGQKERWERAAGLVRALSPISRSLHPAELIEAIIEQTSLIPVLAGAPFGEQKVSNLRKLIEMAREPRGLLRGGTEQFAQGLQTLVDSPPAEAQAPLMGGRADVVRFMTVHQSKGLQFPVVILAGLCDRAGGWGTAVKLGPDGEIGVTPKDSISQKTKKTMVTERLNNWQSAREQAEQARLFYVACTRAEQLLVFISSACKKPNPWGIWVRGHVLDGPAVNVLQADELAAGLAQPERAAAYSWPGLLPPDAGPKSQEAHAIVKKAVMGAELAPRVVRESVSAMESWFACPRLYFHTRGLGLDTGALNMPAGGNGSAGQGRAVILGSAVHKLLETGDLWSGPQGLEPYLDAIAKQFGLSGAQAQACLSAAQGLWKTELAQVLAGLPQKNVFREQGFCLHIEQNGLGVELELMGEIDLLLATGHGQMVIDYKVTSKIRPEKYRDQLALYCLALWQGMGSPPEPPRAALCYLTPDSAQLVDMAYSTEELTDYRHRALKAAAAMAAITPEAVSADLAMGSGCPGDCVLNKAGICKPDDLNMDSRGNQGG